MRRLPASALYCVAFYKREKVRRLAHGRSVNAAGRLLGILFFRCKVRYSGGSAIGIWMPDSETDLTRATVRGFGKQSTASRLFIHCSERLRGR